MSRATLRRIALCDGPEAGQEAIAISTGGGLDFWAMLGRGLDIGPAWWRGAPLGWEHPAGLVAPHLVAREGDGGTGIERALGGLLVTCGLDHVRRTADGHPLHGHHPFTPARLLACAERGGRLEIEAETVGYHISRGGFRLRRRIEADVGGAALTLTDRITNIGPAPRELQLLYHWNLCAPWSERDGPAKLDGEPLAGPDGDAAQCQGVPPMPHRVTLGDGAAGLLTLSFHGADLPHLQLWSNRHLGVLAIEPATSARTASGTSGPAAALAPGASHTIRQSLTLA
jgi:hypothetical protein